jgi:hypothetical protein
MGVGWTGMNDARVVFIYLHKHGALQVFCRLITDWWLIISRFLVFFNIFFRST